MCLRMFHPNSNKQVNCMSCRPIARKAVVSKANKKYYQENKEEMLPKYKAYNKSERGKASQKVRDAVRSGKMERKPCEVCSEPNAEGHHDDYSKPLEVRWLCRKHHARHHLYEDWQLEMINAGYKGEFDLKSLIEACGDRFLELYRNPVDKVWSAMSNNYHEYTGKGSSPEQAVKNLWIALNK